MKKKLSRKEIVRIHIKAEAARLATIAAAFHDRPGVSNALQVSIEKSLRAMLRAKP